MWPRFDGKDTDELSHDHSAAYIVDLHRFIASPSAGSQRTLINVDALMSLRVTADYNGHGGTENRSHTAESSRQTTLARAAQHRRADHREYQPHPTKDLLTMSTSVTNPADTNREALDEIERALVERYGKHNFGIAPLHVSAEAGATVIEVPVDED